MLSPSTLYGSHKQRNTKEVRRYGTVFPHTRATAVYCVLVYIFIFYMMNNIYHISYIIYFISYILYIEKVYIVQEVGVIYHTVLSSGLLVDSKMYLLFL